MNGRIAVMCPTRDRPHQFESLAGSVLGTSRSADVLFYADDDQYDKYHGLFKGESRVKDFYGPRIGPVASINRLAEKFPDYSIYGMLADDSVLLTPGWDDWCLDVVEQFPKRLCVISPHHDQGNHVDMPFVSKQWMDKAGFFACPRMYHYCWPIITGLIGEMTAIVHAPKQSFGIAHDYHAPGNPEYVTSDSLAFFDYVALRMPAVVERIRIAMYEDASAAN